MFVFRLFASVACDTFTTSGFSLFAPLHFMAACVYSARLGGEHPQLRCRHRKKSRLTFADGKPARVLIFISTSSRCEEDITCHSREGRIIFPSALFSIFIVVISRRLLLRGGSEVPWDYMRRRPSKEKIDLRNCRKLFSKVVSRPWPGLMIRSPAISRRSVNLQPLQSF